MKNNFAIAKCPLFAEIEAANLAELLKCLSAKEHKFEKGNYIFSAEESTPRVGIVTDGSVHIIQEDFWGNRTIFSYVKPGELFGESFACGDTKTLPVSIIAAEDCKILMIDLARIVTTCSSACAFHSALIKNMLKILAIKNISLVQKMGILTRRTTREKLLTYLSEQAKAAASATFEIPLNRQELADYLAVERSAMSAELSRMNSEGLIKYKRNYFELLDLS
jgi:CRP-like cAMP-binding protein